MISQSAFIDLLKELSPEIVWECAHKALTSRNEISRSFAIDALSSAPEVGVPEIVKNGLLDGDEHVRCASYKHINKIPADERDEFLFDGLRDTLLPLQEVVSQMEFVSQDRRVEFARRAFANKDAVVRSIVLKKMKFLDPADRLL